MLVIELYIISGPWGQGGTGSVGYETTISSKKHNRSSLRLEIIVVLPVGSSDISRINTSTRVIAVWMPNNQTVSSNHGDTTVLLLITFKVKRL
jgi:endonuclease G